MARAASVRALEPAELAAQATAALHRSGVDAFVADVDQLTGGASGLTYTGRLLSGDTVSEIIIKAAPPGLAPTGNRDVLRQARALTTLAPFADVAVPQVMATDPGDGLDQPPLFVMSRARGESYEPQVTVEPTHADRDEIIERVFAAADMAAALHAVPVDTPGLSEEKPGSLEHELARWAKAFSVVHENLRFTSGDVLSTLAQEIPSPVPPAMLHGDFRLGNMLCDGPKITAVIDWEVWSIGDPRLDLAWLALFMTPGHPHACRNIDDLPGPPEVVSRYEMTADRRAGELSWFGALARYKQAAASALIIRNNRKLAQPGVDTSFLLDAIPKLLRSAQELLS